MLRKVEVTSSPCGSATEQKRERIFTLNGAIRPRIPINSGERQFWRIVNASPDLYAHIQLSGGQFEILAMDGMPLSYHDPGRSTGKVDHVLLPPAGRVEAIVDGPPSGSAATLSTRNANRASNLVLPELVDLRSKLQSQTDLEDSGGQRSQNLGEVRSVINGRIGSCKVRMIKQIERLRAKLETDSFVQGEVLHQTEIPILQV